MNKKTLTALVAVIAVVGVVAAVAVIRNQAPPTQGQPVNNNGAEYVIDMSSDLDTSDWPTFTDERLGFSIKYHQDGKWQGNNPTSDPAADSPSFYLKDPYAGFWDFDKFIPATSFEEWLKEYKKPAFLIIDQRSLIVGKQALIELVGATERNKDYRIHLYSEEREGVFVIRMKSEYTEAGFPNKEENIKIYKAMLQTMRFQPSTK